MKSIFVWLAVLTLIRAAPSVVVADEQLSPDRIDAVDQLGYLTPSFKQAVHDFVFTKSSLSDAKTEEAKLNAEIPSLKKKAAAAQASAAVLRQELARYEHPEEVDFKLLQTCLSDAHSTSAEQLAQAQAYVWSYPTSPHESDAQQDLQQIQKKMSDQEQSVRQAEAQRAEAHAELVKQAMAHNLTLSEWRDFLRNMSQEQIVELIGHPNSIENDDWIYEGAWAKDRAGKTGLEVTFDAGRVINVDEKPSPP